MVHVEVRQYINASGLVSLITAGTLRETERRVFGFRKLDLVEKAVHNYHERTGYGMAEQVISTRNTQHPFCGVTVSVRGVFIMIRGKTLLPSFSFPSCRCFFS